MRTAGFSTTKTGTEVEYVGWCLGSGVKTAFISGVVGGIGTALVVAFARQG